MNYQEDTIAAIATPYGTGGLGIVRMSGKDAFDIAERIFRGRKPFSQLKSHTVSYGKIVDPKDDSIIDEVLIKKMKAPNTFTMEDTVEIDCHGGIVVLRRVLDLIVREGARPALPGEFSKRAFLNGRMDLSQAEAVIDLICSKTELSSKAAVSQLEGKLSRKLKEIRQTLVELLAHIAVTVDYPEDDIEEITAEKIEESLGIINSKIKDMLAQFEKGRILREGVKAVIVGRPNVGKSSLLNELTGKNRAIVTDIPGTTRDVIEEYISINGIPLMIIDTAGIRDTEDVVEKLGVERTHKEIEEADLIIFMLDAVQPLNDDEIKLLDALKNRRHIVLLNKIDLLKGEEPNFPELNGRTVIKTSVKNEIGLDRLEEEITNIFMSGGIDVDSETLVTNVRHSNLLQKALESIDRALEANKTGMPLDMMSIDIRDAADFIGEITGESVSDEVIHEIFSRFCVGK